MITNKFRKADMQELLSVEADPCISIYLPTHERGIETKEDPIRFKNLLRRSEKQLNERGITGTDQILRPAIDLLQDATAWQHLQQGLAIFLSSDIFRTFALPVEFQEQVWVQTRFHIKPLVSVSHGEGRFSVLALSRGQTMLYEADRWGMRQVALQDAPRSLAEFLQYDEAQEELQYRTVPVGKSSGTAAVFHGHGNVADKAQRKRGVDEYIKAVRNAVEKHLAADNYPLVLVAPLYVQSTYRQVSRYNYLLPDGIQQSPDHLGESELHERSRAIVEPHFRQSASDRLRDYRRLIATGQASDQLDRILPAAKEGRVRTLLLDPTAAAPSETAIGSEQDLLDEAVRYTLSRGGDVYAIDRREMPSGSVAGAVFRY